MLLITILLVTIVVQQAHSFILFSSSFVLQLTACISVPSGIPNRTFSLNLCMQGNYNAISNVSQLNPTVIQAKSNYLQNNNNFDFDRKTLYGYITNVFNDYVYNGEECLKRLICETAASTIDTTHRNSLLEKILLYIVTPSKDVFSRNDTEMMIYHEAEEKGRLKENCLLEYSDCEFSILDFLTAKFKL